VQDIRRAEEITENFKLLGSPTDIIFAYKELQDQLQEALRDKIEFADSIGVSDAQINQLRFQVEGDAAKRKRIDESLDQFIAQALDGYTSLDDLLDKLNFGELQIIQQEAEEMGKQAG
jgi:predicted nuclease with TOPRIM domain